MKSIRLIGCSVALGAFFFVIPASALRAQTPAPNTRELDPMDTMNDAKALTPATRLPLSVKKVFDESVVDVLVDYGDHGRLDLVLEGMGFFVKPTIILTRYHLIDPTRALARNRAMRRRVKIVRGGFVYDARVIYYDKNLDLLLLRVPDDAYGYVTTISNEDLDPNDALPDYFSFGCGPDDFTEYYIEHSQFYGYKPAGAFLKPFFVAGRLGAVEGRSRPGYSGSPLLDDRGVVYGIVFGSTDQKPFETLFTSGRDVNKFLGTAMYFLLQEKDKRYARATRPALR